MNQIEPQIATRTLVATRSTAKIGQRSCVSAPGPSTVIMSSPYAEPAATEDRAPEEIFSKVNAYTEAVSMIVQKQVEAWLSSTVTG